MMRKIRIGVLGCSDIALRRFLPAVLKSKNASLTAIASRNPVKAKECCPVDAQPLSYDELLASPHVDLVYISLPNHLHEEWTLKALDHGKHVLCEKPLALDHASAERMVASAEKNNLLLYENIMYLHHPQHQTIRSLIAAGAVGKVRALRAGFGFTLAREGFRRNADEGGGVFHDLARYPISAALNFLQGETYRFAGFSVMRGDLNVGMSVSAVTSAGEIFSFSISFEQHYECWYEIMGETGSLRIDRAFTIPADLPNEIQIRKGRTKTSAPVPAADHFQLAVDHVCELLHNRSGYADVFRQARRLSSVAEQAYACCEQQTLPEGIR